MKTFDQLTKQQQKVAKLLAYSILIESIHSGMIESIGPDQIIPYSEAAAEDALYSESGDLLIDAVAN